MKQFYEVLGPRNMRYAINNALINEIGNTCVHGSNQIDPMSESARVKDYINRCKLMGNNDMVKSNHQSYVINAALKDYFNNEL